MENQAFELIRTKHVVREFSDEPLPDEVVRQILEAGRLSPSWANTQPWRFIAVRNRDTLRRIAELNPNAGHLAGAALGVVIVAPEPSSSGSPEFDFGRAVQNMMLTAHGVGVGSVVGYLKQPEETAKLLGVPEGHRVAWVVSFGYPANKQDRPARRGGRLPFDEVVHWEKW
ncbi:MAG TPA: nitroreductase family protein [Aggregatilineales bacterium]|nr:nitroreductase family protein [Aggregatilineales bacterium]